MIAPGVVAVVAAVIVAGIGLVGCMPVRAPRPQADAPRRRRGIDVSGPFLDFHGAAKQMGDLNHVAANFRVIAVDADPLHDKFSRADIATLRAGGRNIVLGILNVGFCDRDQSYWRRASDGFMPCVSRLEAQIGERAGHPRQVWMDLEDIEYQRLIGEYIAPRLYRAGVDGFLLDGLELLDHAPDDDAGCDDDCFDGGIALLAGLRQEFPDLVFLMQGGLTRRVRGARVGHKRVASLIDGIIGEEVYTPSYNADKENDLLAWKSMGLTVNGLPLAVITQDYVDSCKDSAWASMVARASRAHGFSPAVGLSPVKRAQVCDWLPDGP
jgi:cysteinyl-tRNA synthetase